MKKSSILIITISAVYALFHLSQYASGFYWAGVDPMSYPTATSYGLVYHVNNDIGLTLMTWKQYGIISIFGFFVMCVIGYGVDKAQNAK